MSPKPKPVRIIPPLTDAELDSRTTHETEARGGAAVGPDTLWRVNEALKWHERRAKGKA